MEGAIRELIDRPVMNLQELRLISARGVPDNLRASVWKFVLGYIPIVKSSRAGSILASREQYRIFLDEVVTRPQHTDEEVALSSSISFEEPSLGRTVTEVPPSVTSSPSLTGSASKVLGGSPEVHPIHLKRLEVVDDPLSHLASPGRGKWEQWHLDEELRLEIDKDIQASSFRYAAM